LHSDPTYGKPPAVISGGYRTYTMCCRGVEGLVGVMGDLR
jgi:hypothetical protein